MLSRPRADSAKADGEDHVTVQQKMAVSKEMTTLLAKRLEEMKDINRVRLHGLALDQEQESSVRYAVVEEDRMRRAMEAYAGDLKPVKKRPAKPSAAAVAAAAAAERAAADDADGAGDVDDAASEPFDEADLETLSPSRFRAARRSSLVAMHQYETDGDAARFRRIKALRRVLREAEATHVGRMIDKFEFFVDEPPPFDIPVDVVLKFVGYRIAVPYNPKYFRFHLLHPLSQAITRHLFWFIFCYSFKPGSDLCQEVLIRSVSEQYISLTQQINKNRYLFLQSYPYAIANAVYASFYYFVPGSRNFYDTKFKLQSYVLIVRLLTGMEVCASAVQNTLEKLFPDERNVNPPTHLPHETRGSASGSDDAADDDSDSGDSLKRLPDPHLISTSALSGDLNARDKRMLGPDDSTRVEALRSLSHTLIVPFLSPVPTSSTLPPPSFSRTAPPGALEPSSSHHMTRTASSNTMARPSSSANMILRASSSSGIRKPLAGHGAGAGGLSRCSSMSSVKPQHSSSLDSAPEESGTGGAGGPKLGLDASEYTDPEVLVPTWHHTETAADVGLQALLRQSKKRQLRMPFCVSNISPLVQRYLRSNKPCIGRPVVLKRTTPVPWSRVGGLDTYHSIKPRTQQQKELRDTLQRASEEYAEDAAESRQLDRKALRDIKTQRVAVLHGGQSARSKFCLFITDQLDNRRRRAGKGEEVSRRENLGSLPVPSRLTSIRAELPEEPKLPARPSTNPAWDNFQASGLGWNPVSAAGEYGLLNSSGQTSKRDGGVGGGSFTGSGPGSPGALPPVGSSRQGTPGSRSGRSGK